MIDNDLMIILLLVVLVIFVWQSYRDSPSSKKRQRVDVGND